MRKINLKMMIIALIVVFLAINLNSKYSEHKELLENKKLLLENKKNFEKKIIEIENPNNPMEIFFNEIQNFKKEVILNL